MDRNDDPNDHLSASKPTAAMSKLYCFKLFVCFFYSFIFLELLASVIYHTSAINEFLKKRRRPCSTRPEPRDDERNICRGSSLGSS